MTSLPSRATFSRSHFATSLLAAAGLAAAALAAPPRAAHADASPNPHCRRIWGLLEEDKSTTACRAPDTTCFLGEIRALGLWATTYFHGEAGALVPPGSPGWISYTGSFEYTTARGTLRMRETGVSNPTTGNPESGGVTAHQKVVGGTGEWEGATGYLFVSGFNLDGHVETQVFGELCTP